MQPLSNIKERLARFILSRVPLARRTIYKPLIGEQSLGAANIDVSTVHAILDGTDTGNTNEYFALCDLMLLSDSHIQGEFAKRKLALLGDPLTIAPTNKKNAVDVTAAGLCKEMVDGLPTFLEACASLLDGALLPIGMVEKVYRRASKNPKFNYEVEKLIRVPPRLFDYSTGTLRIWDTDPENGMVLGTKSDVDPMRYIVHRGHLLPTPDYRGGPMRSLVFWWAFSAFGRDWWARFLDTYGSPFMVGKYDQADDDSRIILQNAFALASRIKGLVISRQTEVEIKEAQAKSGGEAFETFIRTANREKSKLIVGQTTSADSETGAGLGGSGLAKTQAQVRGDIRQFDSLWLGNTLKHQLFDPFLKINGIPGDVRVTWGSEESDDITATASAVSSLSTAGIEVTDEGIETLSTRVGLPLQRAKVPTMPPPGRPGSKITPFSAATPDRYELAEMANESVARVGAPGLARAFRGAFAPVGRFIAESSSQEDLIARISTYYADWSPDKLAPLILEALEAQAANGAAREVA